eukprot:6848638-Alexandrium_andersonii.AAC.1
MSGQVSAALPSSTPPPLVWCAPWVPVACPRGYEPSQPPVGRSPLRQEPFRARPPCGPIRRTLSTVISSLRTFWLTRRPAPPHGRTQLPRQLSCGEKPLPALLQCSETG